MKLMAVPDYQSMGVVAAGLIRQVLCRLPTAAIGLTTGNTPVGTYKELCKLAGQGEISFERCKVFSTEEYYGIDRDDPRSLYGWLHRLLLSPCNVRQDNVYRLDGAIADARISCDQFHESIRRCGGLDFIIESIGVNGHIGFNEPGSTPDSTTRLVKLTEGTRASNELYWNRPVPEWGLTIGIAEILDAPQILLLASGRHKASAVRDLLTGGESPLLPASYLLRSSHLTLIADEDALSLVEPSERGVNCG